MRETTTGHESTDPHPLAAFMAPHGILSLLVFLLLFVCSHLAFAPSRRDRIFFREYPEGDLVV